MNLLRLGKIQIILTTDLLSRGVDIANVQLVVCFDLPRNLDTYFHRIGRTARFGSSGVAIAFVSGAAGQKLFLSEKNKKYNIQAEKLPENLESIRAKIGGQTIKKKGKNPKNSIYVEINRKPEHNYGNFSQVSGWKKRNHKFYEETKWKFWVKPEKVDLKAKIEIRKGLERLGIKS